MALPEWAFGAPDSRLLPTDTIPCHAHPTLAQAVVDLVGDGLGASLLAPVRSAEFSFLLRSRKYRDHNRSLDREPADIFVAGDQPTVFSDFIHYRLSGRSSEWTTSDRRNGIYVRSAYSIIDTPAQSVSRGDAAVAAVGDMAFRLRPPRLESADAHRMDCRTN